MLKLISRGSLFRCLLILCAIVVGFVSLMSWGGQNVPSPFAFLKINESSEAQNAKSNERDFDFNLDLNQNDKELLSMIDDIVASDTSGKERWHFQELGNITCSGAPTFHGVEDLLCQEPPKFLPDYKNPCWKREDGLACLPRFRMLGVSKSGTTDLFYRVLQHPDIVPGDVGRWKETVWWSCKRYGHLRQRNNMPIEDFNRYLQYFATASRTIPNNSHMITADGNPRELYCMDGWVLIPQNQGLKEPYFLTPHLIRHINPDVKLLVIMRDPIERSYSDYYFLGGANYTPATFDKAIRSAIPLLHKCIRFSSLRSCLYNRTVKLGFWKLARIHIGFYSVYMRDWLNAFPREQFMFIRSKDFHEDVGKYMQQIYQFVGIRALSPSELDSIVNVQPKRVTKAKTSKGPMLEKTRFLLKRLFQPFNNELASLTNYSGFQWT